MAANSDASGRRIDAGDPREAAAGAGDHRYRVVVNHEEQYSIWPAHKPLPPGWTDAGKEGTKADCLAHIETVWIDMRPLSLRRATEQPTGQA